MSRTATHTKSHPTREAYTAKIKEQIDALNTKMDLLDTKALEAKEDVREAYHAEMLKLRHQSRAAMAKFEEMKSAGEDSWDKMVAEMEKVSDAFKHSFNYFKSQV